MTSNMRPKSKVLRSKFAWPLPRHAPRTWKWLSVLNQDLYLGFGDAARNEMAVVQGQGQSRDVPHQPRRRFRMGSQRADVGFDSVDDAVLASLFPPASSTLLRPGPKSRCAFRSRKCTPGSPLTCLGTAFEGVFEGFEEPIARFVPTPLLGM